MERIAGFYIIVIFNVSNEFWKRMYVQDLKKEIKDEDYIKKISIIHDEGFNENRGAIAVGN